MITSKRSKYDGSTFDERLLSLVEDLQFDEKEPGLVIEIIQSAFDLEGCDLARGVRAALLALMQAGARPAKYSRGTPEKYIPLSGYGETPEEITDTLMRHFQEKGYPERYMGGCILVAQEWFNHRQTEADIAREEACYRDTLAVSQFYESQIKKD